MQRTAGPALLELQIECARLLHRVVEAKPDLYEAHANLATALDEMKREELGEWFGRELEVRPRTVLFVTHHIDEAVLLADRVIVFSTAPGRIREDVAIPVPRPRRSSFRSDPRFVEISTHLRELLFEREGAAA